MRAAHFPGVQFISYVINMKRGHLRGCLWIGKSGIGEMRTPHVQEKSNRADKLSRMNCFRVRTIESSGSSARIIAESIARRGS